MIYRGGVNLRAQKVYARTHYFSYTERRKYVKLIKQLLLKKKISKIIVNLTKKRSVTTTVKKQGQSKLQLIQRIQN